MDYKAKFDLHERVIVVTGAVGLVGREFCEAIAQFGGNVVAVDIPHAKPERFANDLAEKYNREMMGISIDVSKKGDVVKLRDAISGKFGRLDGLVNAHQNKSHLVFEPFEAVSEENWDTVVEINLKGTFLTCQVLGTWMAKTGKGSIVNMPSTYSVVAPNQNLYKGTSLGCPAAYSASKGGIDALSRYLASYWGDKGVRVNMITPHGVWNQHEKQFEENFSQFSPMRRMSRSHEVASALVYLLSDASSYTTGDNLLVEGGWTVW